MRGGKEIKYKILSSFFKRKYFEPVTFTVAVIRGSIVQRYCIALSSFFLHFLVLMSLP